MPLQLAIFERGSHSGGRFRSIHKHNGDGEGTVELGAHTFNAEDALINELAKDVCAEPQDQFPDTLVAPLSQVSVWDVGRCFEQYETVLLTWINFKELVRQNLGSRCFWNQWVVGSKAIWNKDWAYAKWVGIGNDGPDQDMLMELARALGLSVERHRLVGNIDDVCLCRLGTRRDRGLLRKAGANSGSVDAI